jgi:hypothetical protein
MRRHTPISAFFESELTSILEDNESEIGYEIEDEEGEEDVPHLPENLDIHMDDILSILSGYPVKMTADDLPKPILEQTLENKLLSPSNLPCTPDNMEEYRHATDIHEFLALQEAHHLERKVLMKLPVHFLSDESKDNMKVVLLECICDHLPNPEQCDPPESAERAKHADRIDRIERSASSSRYIVKDYIIHLVTSVALLCLNIPFLEEEIKLGCITPELLFRVDLASVCCGSQTYYRNRKQLFSISRDLAINLLEALGKQYTIDPEDWKEYPTSSNSDENNEEWKCKVGKGSRITPEKVNMNVCVTCFKPRQIFRSVHKTPNSGSYDVIGFCSIKCFNDITWPSKALVANINKIKYN